MDLIRRRIKAAVIGAVVLPRIPLDLVQAPGQAVTTVLDWCVAEDPRMKIFIFVRNFDPDCAASRGDRNFRYGGANHRLCPIVAADGEVDRVGLALVLEGPDLDVHTVAEAWTGHNDDVVIYDTAAGLHAVQMHTGLETLGLNRAGDRSRFHGCLEQSAGPPDLFEVLFASGHGGLPVRKGRVGVIVPPVKSRMRLVRHSDNCDGARKARRRKQAKELLPHRINLLRFGLSFTAIPEWDLVSFHRDRSRFMNVLASLLAPCGALGVFSRILPRSYTRGSPTFIESYFRADSFQQALP